MMMEVQGEPNEVDSDHLEDETRLDADKGELLVLRRLSHAQDSPYDKAQRKTIFHFRCTIQDKVCNLIMMEEVVLMWPPLFLLRSLVLLLFLILRFTRCV